MPSGHVPIEGSEREALPGAYEDAQFWTEQSRRVYDEAFQEAAALGMSVFVAAGDNGSSDGLGGGRLIERSAGQSEGGQRWRSIGSG